MAYASHAVRSCSADWRANDFPGRFKWVFLVGPAFLGLLEPRKIPDDACKQYALHLVVCLVVNVCHIYLHGSSSIMTS